MLKLINHPIILYKYFTKDLFKFFLFSLFFLIILIFFIDLIELFRRSSNKIGVNHLLKADFIDLAGMASLKILGNIQKILPFAALIGSIACFNQWRKKNYYVISKASGVSLWKILSPILVSFFFVGLFSIIVLNPFSTLMNKKYENLETIFFGKVNIQELSFDTKGFWIKHISGKRNLIINANKIDEKTLEKIFDNYLSQSYIFFLNRNSSELSKNVLTEVNRVIIGVIYPMLLAISKVAIVIFITILLLYANPKLSILISVTLTIAYGIVYYLVREYLRNIGELSTKATFKKFKLFDSDSLNLLHRRVFFSIIIC